MSTTNKRLLQANARALLLRSVELWAGIQNIMGYVLIADRKTLVSMITIDRRGDRKRYGFPIYVTVVVCLLPNQQCS